MENVITNLFGNSDQLNYIDIIISFIEISITMLSLVTVFFNINYENNVLKMREIIWDIRNTNDFKEINRKLYDFYSIEKTRFKIYDKMIYIFRTISTLIILAILTILIIKLNVVNTVGESMFLIIMSVVVIGTIFFIINIFKTSKGNKDIYNYKELINMDNLDKIFEENMEIIPKIKIFVSSFNGDVEVEYIYPIYCYNINVGICLLDKFCYSYKSSEYKDTDFRKELIERKSFSDIKTNKFLYSNLKDKQSIDIKAKIITKSVQKNIRYNALIDTTEDGILIQTTDYKLDNSNFLVLEKNMEKDGQKFFE